MVRRAAEATAVRLGSEMRVLARENVLLLLAVVGVGIGGYLAWVALDAESEAFCSGVGDCHTVQSSEYAEVAGIPVAVGRQNLIGAALS